MPFPIVSIERRVISIIALGDHSCPSSIITTFVGGSMSKIGSVYEYEGIRGTNSLGEEVEHIHAIETLASQAL